MMTAEVLSRVAPQTPRVPVSRRARDGVALAALHHRAHRGVKLLPPFFFSTPADVAARIVKWFAEGTIWKHLWITLVESVLAFVIGSVAGVLIGFWFAQQPLVAAVFDPYVKMINALPRVVLAPIFALW